MALAGNRGPASLRTLRRDGSLIQDLSQNPIQDPIQDPIQTRAGQAAVQASSFQHRGLRSVDPPSQGRSPHHRDGSSRVLAERPCPGAARAAADEPTHSGATAVRGLAAAGCPRSAVESSAPGNRPCFPREQAGSSAAAWRSASRAARPASVAWASAVGTGASAAPAASTGGRPSPDAHRRHPHGPWRVGHRRPRAAPRRPRRQRRPPRPREPRTHWTAASNETPREGKGRRITIYGWRPRPVRLTSSARGACGRSPA